MWADSDLSERVNSQLNYLVFFCVLGECTCAAFLSFDGEMRGRDWVAENGRQAWRVMRVQGWLRESCKLIAESMGMVAAVKYVQERIVAGGQLAGIYIAPSVAVSALNAAEVWSGSRVATASMY